MKDFIYKFIPKNSFSIIVSQGIRAGTVFLFGILCAHYLPKYEVKNVENFLLITTTLSFFWVSGFTNMYLPSFGKSADKEKTNGSYLSLSFLFGLFFSIVLLIVYQPQNLITGVILFLGFLFYTLSFCFDYLLFTSGKNNSLIIISVLYSFLSVLGLIFAFSIEAKFSSFIIVLGSLSLSKSIIMSLIVRKSFQISKVDILIFLTKATPFLLAMFLSGAFTFLDSWIVKYIASDDEFLLYRYGIKEIPIIMIVSNGFSNTYSMVLSSSKEKGNWFETLLFLKMESKKIIRIAVIFVPLLALIAIPFYHYFYGEYFSKSAMIFNLMLLINIPRMIFPQTILLSLGKNHLLLFSTVIEIFCNLALSIILYQWIGLYGVVISTFLAYFVERMLQIYYLRKIKIKVSSFIPLKMFYLSSFIILFFIILTSFLYKTQILINLLP